MQIRIYAMLNHVCWHHAVLLLLFRLPLAQAFDDAEQEQHKPHHRPPKGLAWMLGRKSGGPPPHVKQLQHKAHEGAAWVQSRIKPLLASLKAKATGNQKKKYTRAEVEQLVRALSAEAKAKNRDQAAAEAYPEGYGYHDSYDNYRDSYSRDGHYSSSKPQQQSKAEVYGQPSADHDMLLTPYGTDSDAYGYTDGTTAEVMSVFDTAEDPLAAVQAEEALWDEAAGPSGKPLNLVPLAEMQQDGPHAATNPSTWPTSDAAQHKGDSRGDHKEPKKPPHRPHAAAHAEAKKHAKAAKTAHTSSNAAAPSSSKAKHKKVHTAATGSQQAAFTANSDQLLDASEATEIKNILDAIYGTSRAGDAPGLDAATLSEIQAALQPHFITDDPEAYALGFGEDSSTGSSIPSEQAVIADKNQHAAAAPSTAKKAPSKPAASPPSSTKPSKAAPRTDKPAAAAAPAPAPAAAVDEEFEVVYVEEEVEEGEDTAFSTGPVPETDDKEDGSAAAARKSKEALALGTGYKAGSSSSKGSQDKSDSGNSEATKQLPRHDAAGTDGAASGSKGDSKAPSKSSTHAESKPAAPSQPESKSSSGKVAAASSSSTSSRSRSERKVKAKLTQAKGEELQPEEEPPLWDTGAARSFSATWDDEEEEQQDDVPAARVFSKSSQTTKSDSPQQAPAAKAGSKGSNPEAPAQSCPAGSVPVGATKCACKAGSFSKDGTAFGEGGCIPCAAGTIASTQGSTKCRKCAPNTFANKAATECTAAAAPTQKH
jgi:hypothetical protein